MKWNASFVSWVINANTAIDINIDTSSGTHSATVPKIVIDLFDIWYDIWYQCDIIPDPDLTIFITIDGRDFPDT